MADGLLIDRSVPFVPHYFVEVNTAAAAAAAAAERAVFPLP